MKLVLVSDTHGACINIPKCDILIHAGDICTSQSFHYQIVLLNKFQSWLQTLTTRCVFVPGNHDLIFEKSKHLANLSCDILIDKLIEINGLKIYGSPWQLPFGENWAFNTSEEQLEKKYSLIPNDTDVIISHGPPYGFGDKIINGFHVGSKSLLNVIKKINPKLVVTGHVHEGYGIYKYKKTTIVNASIMDVDYQPINKPIEIEL